MLSESIINIFARVVKRRIAEEEKPADEVLGAYPALTDDEREDILGRLEVVV